MTIGDFPIKFLEKPWVRETIKMYFDLTKFFGGLGVFIVILRTFIHGFDLGDIKLALQITVFAPPIIMFLLVIKVFVFGIPKRPFGEKE